MTKTFLSSGDLIVDRRALYAQMLAEAGDFSSAADLMEQALHDAPDWAAGWMMAGDFHLRAATLGAAIAAWERAAQHDPSGVLGAQMQLAAHGIGNVEAEAQAAYVEALFDQYAGQFEQALLQKLDYVVPELLAALICETMAELGTDGFARGLDLGCGTGLMGERLRHLVSHLTGVDISAAMVTETREKGIYDGVERADLADFLGEGVHAADIVTAADVFMYCPALPPIFALVRTALRPGGLFAFSVERHDGEEAQWLQASLRFAHNGDAIARGLAEAGFEVLRVMTETIRTDRGMPVWGLLYIARRPHDNDAMEVSDLAIGAELPTLSVN
ncbi:class I SAM-dependent DNA methyltransferase [Pelagibacterium sp.]|uniref:class I SAM-dependent DNA methyltransferase n=1 Tax=Pelagibacterium sp. TaxID=1967288 RepID=UPI003A922149